MYIASQPCCSQCGVCCSEGSLLMCARKLAIMTTTKGSEMVSEGADTLVKKGVMDETFV